MSVLKRTKVKDAKEVVKKEEIQENLPLVAELGVGMFEQDAGLGLEGADKSSYAIPFIAVLQGLSPQLETVEGSRPGLFINTITEELYKEVIVIPCAFQRRYLRWAPRAIGGGFKGEFSPFEVETGKLKTTTDDKGKLYYGEDLLKDTRNHFVLAKSENGGWTPALISLSSTQVKKSKRWLSLIGGIELRNTIGKAFNPPSFSHEYRLRSVKEENSEGSWWGVEISVVQAVTSAEVYEKAKAFHASVTAGNVEVAHPVSESEIHGDTGNSDDIPF